jgi:glycosyltransferase involved in cell wall biosynthesis
MRTHPGVLWSAVLGNNSGYAEEARNFILALCHNGVEVAVESLTGPFSEPVGAIDIDPRVAVFMNKIPTRSFIHVVHYAWPTFRGQHPDALRLVWRVTFETDTLPKQMVERTHSVDQVWVPSSFNADVFVKSGAEQSKLRVVPQPIDEREYDLRSSALPSETDNDFVFMAVFRWQLRKGWDVLLRAYLQEFHAAERVTLLLKVSPFGRDEPLKPNIQLQNFIRQELGLGASSCASVSLLNRDMTRTELLQLYRSANAFVLPSRGEGWGRPYMEAMAMGLPTIGTRWGGQLDYMNDDNSFLIDVKVAEVSEAAAREWPLFKGHRWAEPSVTHLRALMRRVFEDRERAISVGMRAREEILARYNRGRIADAVKERLSELA